MENKPKITPELTFIDRFIELLGWVAVFLLLLITISFYSGLPQKIPTHFNVTGQADNFVRKGSILIIPILVILIFSGLTILSRLPHILNYPVKITTENAIAQYANASRMLRTLKLVLVVVFSTLTYMTFQTAQGHSDGLGFWFLPFSLGIVFIPLAYFIVRMFKLK